MTIRALANAPARMPLMKDGALTLVSPGYLWLPLAVPFAVFAVAYWLIEVVTGWKYTTGNAKAPYVKYCYWTKDNAGGTSTRVDLAQDGKMLGSSTAAPNGPALMMDCQWN